MELDYDPFWFVVLIAVGIIFIAAIFFTIYIVHGFDYEDCLEYDEEGIGICDIIFPPIPLQAINYSIPFP